jgi:oxygen-independent coproporphyrinogen-3 oxidase
MYKSLYIHVPFCSARCDYCAFYSIARHDSELRARYLERLGHELEEHADQCTPMKSIFVGGGTPSALELDELRELIGVFSDRDWMTGAEVTVECNPDSLTDEKVELLARHGVNRLSLGVQSFSPRHRDTLGRKGSIDSLTDVLATVRESGIHNIGIDLIFAIPGQTLGEWAADVREACEMGIRHLSTYELSFEEGTVLSQSGTMPPDEGEVIRMWERAEEVAEEYGLKRYEVSNFAEPGWECRHNDATWHGGTYLGLGPAGCSYDGKVRRANPDDLMAWLSGLPAEEDVLSARQRAVEVLIFGLRTTRGWTPEEFLDATGHDYMLLCGEQLEGFASEGLMELDDKGVRCTRRGLLCGDYIGTMLI